MPFSYPYPRPSVTCDVVVFTMRADDLAVLLIQRKGEPFKGKWALPGGFVNENEALPRAALRELDEETGVSSGKLVQLGAYGDPGRDPRGHTITVAYVTYLMAQPTISAGDDAAEADWIPFRSLHLPPPPEAPPKRGAKIRKAPRITKEKRVKRPKGAIELAFDHGFILRDAYKRLTRHLEDPIRDTSFDLVPPRFTLAELQRVYEVVLGRRYTARGFNKHFLDHELVARVNTRATQPPAKQLYRWNRA